MLCRVVFTPQIRPIKNFRPKCRHLKINPDLKPEPTINLDFRLLNKFRP